MIDAVVARLPFVGAILLIGIGVFVLVDDHDLVKKVVGLNLFQTGIFLFFVAAAVREGGQSPLVEPGGGPYANPVPHVLILTAIVVGVSVTAVALALVVRIERVYGTVDEREIAADTGTSPSVGTGVASADHDPTDGPAVETDGGCDPETDDGWDTETDAEHESASRTPATGTARDTNRGGDA